MKLLVLAFPALDPSDTQRIESARANRDDLSRASVPLHFTLVFATDAIERDALAEHVEKEHADGPGVVCGDFNVCPGPLDS